MLTTRAPAKINLTLAVLGRRDDGYHELDSLVAFAGAGDELSLTPGRPLSLTCSGPFAGALENGDDNLVLKAARALAGEVEGLRAGAFHLVKRLPVASGIGGGSADAAAALRLLARHNAIAIEDPRLERAALAAGADVPVCLASHARRMEGVGERLGPRLTLPRLFAVLVNPLEATPTAAVFAALGLGRGAAGPSAGRSLPPMPDCAPNARERFIDTVLVSNGNDLEPPALSVTPVIGAVLAALRDAPGCRLARMSGSGATCFGLFDDCRSSARAARAIGAAHPGWWVKATVLR
jgi:4-diphosphocytidyl-2-C-methyl-D-erythritol kinase